jgi:hypothetical protein
MCRCPKTGVLYKCNVPVVRESARPDLDRVGTELPAAGQLLRPRQALFVAFDVVVPGGLKKERMFD